MGLFPNFSALSKITSEQLFKRAGANVDVSKKQAWIRIISPVDNGLVMETFSTVSSFAENYGNKERSGKIGVDFAGKPVFAPNDRAYRPSPTIDGIEVEGGNMGLSRKTKFKVTCYSLAQADLLSKYLLEPGYTLLVEFGWNSNDALAQRILLGDKSKIICDFISFNDYIKVQKHRTDSKGEYEGFMGYITDSSFSSTDDEQYLLDVEITSLGEIPTYLQVHRTNVDATKPPSGNNQFKVRDINSDAASSSTIGRSLFQIMYNKLTGAKQTLEVKNMINETDGNNNPWSDAGNYINMDKEIHKNTIKSVKKNKGAEAAEEAGVDLDPIISDQSFIRLELAFEILNKFTINLKPSTPNKNSCGCETYDFRINTYDTIIRAHPWMFSTDSSKLYIPNRQLPNFNLQAVLTSKSTISGGVIDLQQLGNSDYVVDGCPFAATAGPQTDGTSKSTIKEIYEFPSRVELKDAVVWDDNLKVMQIDAKAGEWGYLRNLYINFDFFIEVLNRSDYVAKDVYYEILNGISSAANSYWDFDIFNVPKVEKNEEGQLDLHMAIRDMTFTGRITVSTTKDTNYITINNMEVPIFNASGIDCPFLSSNVNISMPAAKRNQVLAQRNSQNPASKFTQIDSQPINSTKNNIFAKYSPDPVLEVLNSFEVVLNSGPQSEGARARGEGKKEPEETRYFWQKSVAEEKAEAAIKKNVEYFTQRATILPLIKSRKEKISNDTNLNDFLIVGAWNDPVLLKRVELEYISRESQIYNYVSTDGNIDLNAAIIGIDFTFDVIGISSISVGDIFRIKGLPGTFNNSTFQVFTVTHTLSDGFWKTSVTSKQRQL